jgi:hypothetical protein
MVMDVRNPLMQRPRRIKGKSGTRFKVTSSDREANHAMHVEHDSDPFLNGTFKRVDVPTAEVVEQMPDYDQEQTLSDKELLVTFTSSGNAFHAKVKKFTERNVRRMLALAEENAEVVSAAQQAFLTQYIVENYRPGGAPRDAVLD